MWYPTPLLARVIAARFAMSCDLRSSFGHISRSSGVIRVRPATPGRCDGGQREKEENVDETIIRQRLEDFVKAICAKDIDCVTSFYSPDLVSFDLTPPLRHFGADGKRLAWQQAFAA